MGPNRKTPRGEAAAMSSGGWLDRALAEDAAEYRAQYVPDQGFTVRVMQSLPPPVELPAWRKPAILGLWTAAAVGIAVSMPDVTGQLLTDLTRIVATYPVSLSGITTGIV